jgi:hypothetical protein
MAVAAGAAAVAKVVAAGAAAVAKAVAAGAAAVAKVVAAGATVVAAVVAAVVGAVVWAATVAGTMTRTATARISRNVFIEISSIRDRCDGLLNLSLKVCPSLAGLASFSERVHPGASPR